MKVMKKEERKQRYKYSYYSMDQGKRCDKYTSYTDIAVEHGVTKNVIAGKFNRAHKAGSNRIFVDYTWIEQVKEPIEVAQ